MQITDAGPLRVLPYWCAEGACCWPPRACREAVVTDEKGPSWYDAAVALQQLCDAWRLSAEVAVVPNWRVDDRTRFGAWVVAVRVRPRGTDQGRVLAAQSSFGPRADRKTAPGAILVCSTRLWAMLEEAKRLAESQARF